MNLTNKCSLYAACFKVLTYRFALICIFSFSIYISRVDSQPLSNLTMKQSKINHRSQMLLFADKLVFDHDTDTITAEGGVQIRYSGNRIVARHVSYNQKTKRVIAEGNVKIVDAKGFKLYAKRIDLTDDLGEGFINSLRLETLDKTYFTAESATRNREQMTIFNNGVYTACEFCQRKLRKDVSWQIKAKRIIWNNNAKNIRFENSKFEIFGIPIAKLSTFEIADSTVKRKNGFLAPHFSYKSYLGFAIKNSYFWNLAPNYDFTFSTTGYSKEGILTQGEWRHLLEKGEYNIRFSYLYQTKRNNLDYWIPEQHKTNRYMFSTKGQFTINPCWVYGWDIMAESDSNFGRTYEISGYNEAVQRSQIYLKGLYGRNYFNMHFYHFNIQENILRNDPEQNIYKQHYSKQPWVLPRIDYTFIPEKAVFDGELKFTANLQMLYREKTDFALSNAAVKSFASISRTNTHLTNKLQWKRTFINNYGFVFTPIFSIRSDIIDNYKNNPQTDQYYNTLHGMATIGLETHYPLLLITDNSSHIIEPIAQIFVRNNEQYTNRYVNEDAQSFVFDATTLFLCDKFSGYDRLEGGTRANIGVRYSTNFNNNWSIYGLTGQSYQLIGRNSYDFNDVIYISANSGLEGARSDYVAMLSIDDGNGFTLTSRGRLDKKNLIIRRGEIDLQKRFNPLMFGLQYAYIERQADYEYAQNRQEISVRNDFRLNDKWQLSANASYDIVSNTLIDTGTKLSYQNECVELAFGYLRSRSPREHAISHKWNFLISFRTIGDFGSNILP
ncbi:MAG: LPS-assembly protein [Candidatus Tokpelaia sp. JSC188]|nr:MAG: LPS-assembly protein [Candidatus Tokpelaia sp. JSC188]